MTEMIRSSSSSNKDDKVAYHATSAFASLTEDSLNGEGALINASGHREQLERNFSVWSIIAYAITAGNTWVSLGGTIVRTPFGGPICDAWEISTS